MVNKKVLITCALALSSLIGCTISGYTGGGRDFTIGQMEGMTDVYFKEFSDNHGIIPGTTPELKKSQCIMRALGRAINGAFAGMRTEWSVEVTRDCSMNATVLSNGHLVISNCVVGMLNNQDEAAYIIAHAYAHNLLEHDNERLSTYLSGVSKKDLNIKMYLRTPDGYNNFTKAVGLPDKEGEILPYTMDHERAADVFAIQMMANAGFNPSGALIVWQDMNTRDELNAEKFRGIHPHSSEYLNELSNLVEGAMPIYRKMRTEFGRKPMCQ